MIKPIRWGILGTGFVARQFAADLRVVPGAELVAVGSRSLARAQEFAARTGARKPFGSYPELANDSEIDVVYVATTANQHKDDCCLCLNSNKPVLCEKPFTLNAGEAREIVALARQKRLFCMEAMWMRFQPLIQKTRELIVSGTIGEVRLLTADFGVPTENVPGKWYFNPALGGGALLDRGVYCLSLAFFLLGEPDSISGQATFGPSGADEQSSILLHYPNGALATLSSSLVTNTSNQASIAGTTGRIVIHEPFYRPRRISISDNPQPARFDALAKENLKHKLMGAINGSQSKFVRGAFSRIRDLLSPLVKRSRSILLPPLGNGYNYEAAEVMRCLRSGELESGIMPLDESVRIMEVMDAIRAQWTEHPADSN